MSEETNMATVTNSRTVKAGMECGIKNLYGMNDARGQYTWTDKYPDDLEEAAENEMTARYAILVRNRKSFDSRKTLGMDSIIIQSPLLKQALNKVLKDYPDVTPKDENYEKTKSHLALLHETLQPELKDIIAARIDYIENKVITYDHLWTIFQPGCTVFTRIWGRNCAVKFTYGAYIRHSMSGPFYQLNCQRVDWDGEKFGLADVRYRIQDLLGTTGIDTLSVFPLEFHQDEIKIRIELLKRGKLFEKYHCYHFKNYKSFAIGKNRDGQSVKVICGQSDAFAYGKFNPNSVESLKALEHKKASGIVDKRWLEFLVDVPTNIVWNDSAFQSLVLPPSQKDLILAIATSQISSSSRFDDVISGKGKGTILLLSGGPGTGKTLTAESVAETMRVPLYMLSAGDLGTDSMDVESALGLILDMVTSWNAVLLLDECDVFLEVTNFKLS
ncbi:hypothetical protein OCU04_001537 [Sclerotinia nivalis]|uniref:ATPase AAA-type core domain-containing protein n=1 Tax=Sclerotinia nivalis TaxID=352851 RepID=A0A9X0AYZ6_9HELO|nr:hypothetical protein OCU04_001537 [Sclerotinia nivalis]